MAEKNNEKEGGSFSGDQNSASGDVVEQFKCSKCEKVYEHSSTLSRHIQSCLLQRSFECSNCDSTFDRKDSLVRHAKTCKGPQHDWKCDKCAKTFEFNSYLKHHKCSIKCPTCRKKIDDNDNHVCQGLLVKLPKNRTKIVNRKRKLLEDVPSSSGACADPGEDTSLCDGGGGDDHLSCFDDSIPLKMWDLINDSCLIDYAPDFQITAGSSLDLDSKNFTHIISSRSSYCMVHEDFGLPHQNEQPPIEQAVNPAISIADIPVEQADIPLEQAACLESSDITVSEAAILITAIPLDHPDTPLDEQPPIVQTALPTKTIDQRRQRAAERVKDQVLNECQGSGINPEGVMRLALKYLGISDKFSEVNPYVCRTPFETRHCVWVFWHTVSEESTITTALARLRVTERHGCQQDLEFTPTVNIIKKRNRNVFVSIWKTYTVPVVDLHKKYCTENPTHTVSIGMFLNLRPFYIRNVGLKDMEMCVCKVHLHARWCINAMIKLANKLSISLPFDNYKGFFDLLYTNCDDMEHTYITWKCTPNKKTTCEHITTNFENITHQISNADETTTTPFTHFEKEVQHDENGEVLINKKGKPVKLLVPKKVRASGKFLVKFMWKMLKNFVHHRNMLKLYRNLKHTFLETMKSVYIDMDFSENLTIGIRKEPQSLHWCKTQVTIHSGLVKYGNEKVYHPYVSNSRTHDQTFVRLSFEQIIDHTDVPERVWIVWETDNCSMQYKSAEHLVDFQQLANSLMTTIIRLWGIAMHGKGEVDHVGGVAKVAARRAIAGGKVFENSTEIVSFLQGKFGDNTSPQYHVVEILETTLNEERDARCKKKFKTIEGSSEFHVAVFTPQTTTFKASPRLCLCDQCMVNYGSCSLFTSYELQVQCLNTPALRNYIAPPTEIVGQEEVNEFVSVGTYVAVAAPRSSVDTVWLIKVIEVNRIDYEYESVDSFGLKIAPKVMHLSGHFLEKNDKKSNTKETVYDLSKNVTYFFKESIVYPYVNIQEGKCGLSLNMNDYTDILYHIESNAFAHL